MKVFVKKESFLPRHVETVSRNRFTLANVLLPFVRCDLVGCEL